MSPISPPPRSVALVTLGCARNEVDSEELAARLAGGGWAIYRYGFGVPTDPAAGETASPTDVTLSNCAIQMGAAAKASIFAST